MGNSSDKPNDSMRNSSDKPNDAMGNSSDKPNDMIFYNMSSTTIFMHIYIMCKKIMHIRTVMSGHYLFVYLFKFKNHRMILRKCDMYSMPLEVNPISSSFPAI
jgi:hypothetical protein